MSDDLEALLGGGEEEAMAPARHPHALEGRDMAELLERREAMLHRLREDPFGFDFFQCMRRMEALYPELPGVGRSDRSAEDPVRFCQEATLAFSPSNLRRYIPRGSVSEPRLFLSHMGLLGPNGPLPLHLTEHARQREIHAKDPTFSRFLDVFNHRMVSLFYRAWAACSMPASADRSGFVTRGGLTPRQRDAIFAEESNRYLVYVGSLVGLGSDGVRHRDEVPDIAKLSLSGRLVGSSRTAEGLAAVVSTYFGVPCAVEEFTGAWLELPREHACRLGAPGVGVARGSNQLGTLSGGGAVMGGRVWSSQSAIRLVLGPMGLEAFEGMLPGGMNEQRLRDWMRMYVGDELQWEAVLVLRAAEVPTTRLGTGARLGLTTWLRGEPEVEDRADVTLRWAGIEPVGWEEIDEARLGLGERGELGEGADRG